MESRRLVWSGGISVWCRDASRAELAEPTAAGATGAPFPLLEPMLTMPRSEFLLLALGCGRGCGGEFVAGSDFVAGQNSRDTRLGFAPVYISDLLKPTCILNAPLLQSVRLFPS